MDYKWNHPEKFKDKIKWQFLLIILSSALIPVFLITAFSIFNLFSYLEREIHDNYHSQLKQAAYNLDFIYEQYGMSLSNVFKNKSIIEGLNAPPYQSKSDEMIICHKIIGSNEDSSGLRNLVEEKFNGAGFIIELDRKSIIKEKNYMIHESATSNTTFPTINMEQLLNDPLFQLLKTNADIRFVLGKLQPGTLSGFEADKKTVFMLPYYPTGSSGTKKSFSKFILLILNTDFIDQIYRNIDELKFGTLYVLDENMNIITRNHPGNDDYYHYDSQSNDYILQSDDLNYDPEEGMSFFEYNLLNTDENLVKSKYVVENINDDMEISNHPHQKIHYINYWGNRYMIIFHIAPQSGARFVFFYPVYQIYKPIINILVIFITITFLVAGIILIISLILSSRMTRPIYRLAESSTQLSEGNFQIPDLEITTQNEIGLLTDTFNKMKNVIRNYTDTLEQTIRERTLDLEKANQALQITNQKVMEQSQFKSKYLANMSHEVRTPLNSILGFNQLLLFNNYSPDQYILEIIEEIISELEKGVNFKNSELCRFLTEITGPDSIKNIKYIIFRLIQNRYHEYATVNKLDEKTINKTNSLIAEIRDLLTDEEQKIKKNLTMTRKSCEYLLHLINSVLDISKIESGKIELVIKPVIVTHFIDEIFSEAVSYSKNKSKDKILAFHKEIDPQIVRPLLFDKFKIKEVLLNLLSNAVKFTEKGSVSLSVFYQSAQLRFSVKDTGVGIHADEIDKLFQEFSRTSSTQSMEGTGLGLSLSKKIIDLHGGTIEVKTRYGEGSEFIVSIPVKEEE